MALISFLIFNLHFFFYVVSTLQSFNECVSSMQRLSQTEDPTVNSRAKHWPPSASYCYDGGEHTAARLSPITKEFVFLCFSLNVFFCPPA